MRSIKINVDKLRMYQLYKQNLLSKTRAATYHKILLDHIALHSTDYMTPYLSLWARVNQFDPKSLFDDLNEPFNALRMRLFRGTIFVIHRENLSKILAASKILLDSIVRQNRQFLEKAGVDLAGIERELIV